MIPIHLVTFKQVPIFQQLQLEEALLRADQRNWCLLNEGTTDAIVLGISGKPEDLIDFNKFSVSPVPLIRRFSGGGTVFVDHQTDFITFIFNGMSVEIPCFPEPILQWTEQFYKPIFAPQPFHVKENDYVIEQKKVGGNAQYICKNRWLHHTSFLWGYDPEKMDYLTLPKKMPTYRLKRPHKDFLCSLNHYWEDRQSVKQRIIERLNSLFDVKEVSLAELEDVLSSPHRKSTQQITIDSKSEF